MTEYDKKKFINEGRNFFGYKGVKFSYMFKKE